MTNIPAPPQHARDAGRRSPRVFLAHAQLALGPAGRTASLDLNPAAEAILDRVRRGVTMGELEEWFLDNYPASRDDLSVFLSGLDDLRVLSTRQSYLAQFMLLLRAALTGLVLVVFYQIAPQRLRFPTERFEGTFAGVTRAVLRAHQATFALAVACLAAVLGFDLVNALGRGVPPLGRTTLGLIVVLSTYFALYPASALLHELAHCAAGRALGVQIRGSYARMFVAGITHGPSASPVQGILVAVAGPLTGLSSLVGFAAVIAVVPLMPAAQMALWFAAAGIGVMHLTALLPASADGRDFWAQLRRLTRRHGES